MLIGDFVLSMERTELRAKTLLKGENVLDTYLYVLRQPVARHFLTFFLLLKCFFIIFFIELSIINFIEYGTLQDRRHDVSGRPVSVTTHENVERNKDYFKFNPNASIWKVAQALKISKTSLHRILKHFLNMHPYKISSYQLLSERSMGQRVKFCKTITGMFEDRELDEKLIIFTDEAHFYLNGYVNKQNDRFWGSENPSVSISKPLHPQKVSAWAAISIKGIYLQFFESTVTAETYKNLLETKFFLYAKKRGLVTNFHFIQDGAAPHRTQEVFEALHKV